jgi:hypothetical protein
LDLVNYFTSNVSMGPSRKINNKNKRCPGFRAPLLL